MLKWMLKEKEIKYTLHKLYKILDTELFLITVTWYLIVMLMKDKSVIKEYKQLV